MYGITRIASTVKITVVDRLMSPSGFCLPDLTEQFSLPETAPPMLARLLEAIEKKGERALTT